MELPEHHYFRHLAEATKFMAAHPRIRWLALLSALMVAVSIVSFRFLQPLLISVGVPVSNFGTIYLIWVLMSIYAAQKAFFWEKKLGENTALSVIPIGLGIGFFLCGARETWVVLLGTVPLQFAFGFVIPVVSDYINRHVESSHRATILSFRGFAQSILAAILAPLFGWIADVYSLSVALFGMGAVCLLGGLFLVFRIRTAPLIVR